MKRVRITIENENGEQLDTFMVYDENSLTDEQVEDLDFNPEAYEISEVQDFIKRAINKG